MARTGSFTAQMATLLGGTAVAQVIPLLAAPLLTRLYAPEQFGALAVLFAVANPLSVMVAGRYEHAVVLPKSDEQARHVVSVGALVSVLMAVVLGTFILVFREQWAAMLGGDMALVPLLFAPFLLSCMGGFQPFNGWLIRKQAFRAMGLNKVVQTAGITLVSLLGGKLAWEHGLLIGYLAGWAAYLVLVVVQAKRHGYGVSGSAAEWRIAAWNYRSFPFYNAVPAVLYTATLSVPVFYVAQAFDAATAGQFNLCRQVVFLPITFVATSFLQVYMQRSGATAARGAAVLPGLRKGIRLLAVAAVVLVVALLLAGPWAFALVFGAEWEDAGNFARLLAVPVAMQLLVLPLTPVLAAVGKNRDHGIWQLCYFGALCGVSLVHFPDAFSYVRWLAVVEALCLLALAALVFIHAKRHDARIA